MIKTANGRDLEVIGLTSKDNFKPSSNVSGKISKVFTKLDNSKVFKAIEKYSEHNQDSKQGGKVA